MQRTAPRGGFLKELHKFFEIVQFSFSPLQLGRGLIFLLVQAGDELNYFEKRVQVFKEPASS